MDTIDFFLDAGIDLTKQQARLMAALRSKSGIVSQASLINAVWYDDPTGEPDYAESIVKVHISKIRKKIKEAGLQLSIKPFWGVGYSLEHPQGKVLRKVAVSLMFILLMVYPLASVFAF